MNVQNQIKRALSRPESIEYVRGLLEEEEEFFTRSELAEAVCEVAAGVETGAGAGAEDCCGREAAGSHAALGCE